MAVTINGTTGIVTPDIGVDGTTLVVDAVNNRIGIGQSSPTTTLDVNGTGNVSSRLNVGASSLDDRALSAYNTSTTVGAVSATNYNTNGLLFQGYNASVDANNASFVVKSDGSIGIGEPTPVAKLDIKFSQANTVDIRLRNTESNAQMSLYAFGGSAATGSHFNNRIAMMSWNSTEGIDIITNGTGNNDFRVYTAGYGTNSERFRIDSSGRVLIGTTSLIDGSTASNFQIASPSGPRLCIARNNTNVTGGNLMGALDFYGNDSDGNYEICGRMILEADGTHTNDVKPTRMAFYTTPADDDVATERLRITNAGHVSIVGDNQKLLIGSHDDIEIYHDGSASYIHEQGTGDLNLCVGHAGSKFVIQSGLSGGHLAEFNYDGAAELFHSGTQRLETTSLGVKITNNLYLGNSTNGGFSYNSIADTLEFLTTNGGTHSELNAGAYVPNTNGGKNIGQHNKRWNHVFCNGVRFDGNNTVATTLDDYEEGAYVPRLFAGTGTTEPSYNWRYGQYVKIGEVVTVWGALGISGSLPSATQTYIGGLPYNQAFNNNNFFHYTQLHGYTWASGYSDSGADTRLFLQTANGNNDKLLIINGANKNYATHAMIGSNQRFTFCVSYVAG